MKNLIRGCALAMVLTMLAAIVYAQANPFNESVSPKGSHVKIDNNISTIQTNIQTNNNQAVNNNIPVGNSQDDKRKLVKTTAMVTARGRGASRGSFSATAYCLSGKTAMGHGVRRGLIAADSRVLRLGSKVNIEGAGYSGSYLVSDTGGRIKGNKIDIWMPSCAEARKFGRRTVQIFSE